MSLNIFVSQRHVRTNTNKEHRTGMFACVTDWLSEWMSECVYVCRGFEQETGSFSGQSGRRVWLEVYRYEMSRGKKCEQWWTSYYCLSSSSSSSCLRSSNTHWRHCLCDWCAGLLPGRGSPDPGTRTGLVDEGPVTQLWLLRKPQSLHWPLLSVWCHRGLRNSSLMTNSSDSHSVTGRSEARAPAALTSRSRRHRWLWGVSAVAVRVSGFSPAGLFL